MESQKCYCCKREKTKDKDILHSKKWICFSCFYSLREEKRELQIKVKILKKKIEEFSNVLEFNKKVGSLKRAIIQFRNITKELDKYLKEIP